MTKAADIMAAATPGRWAPPDDLDTYQPDDMADIEAIDVEGEDGYPPTVADYLTPANARAIVTAVNLFPFYEAVREAAQFTATRAGDPVEFTHLSPTGPDLLDAIAAYMDRMDDHAERDPYRDGPVSREVQADVRRWAASLRAALDALQAAEDAL